MFAIVVSTRCCRSDCVTTIHNCALNCYNKNNNWSKWFDIMPYRRRARIIQSYSLCGANVHPWFLRPPWTHTQTASRSVQPILQGSLLWPTQTDRQTDHATRVAIGRISRYAMRCGLATTMRVPSPDGGETICERRPNWVSQFHIHFYRAMLCIHGTSHGPVSVCLCLSVCPSQVGVLLKRLNVGSHK